MVLVAIEVSSLEELGEAVVIELAEAEAVSELVLEALSLVVDVVEVQDVVLELDLELDVTLVLRVVIPV